MGGEHHWARASRDLRSRLSRAVPHEVLKELHRKSPGAAHRHRRAAVCAARGRLGGRMAVFRALDLDPGRARLGLDHLQLHRAPPRGGSSRGLQWAEAARRAVPLDSLRRPFGDLRPPVHALAPDASRGARRRGGRPEAALPLAEDQQGLVQAALFHARALPDLLPRGKEGDGELSADAPPADRSGAVGTIVLHVAVMAGLWRLAGFGVLARVYLVPYFLVFPIAFALNRLGQHYAIDPGGPGQVGHAPPAVALVGLLVPLLGLPPGAPLLHGRPVLQPAAPALRPAPVLLRRDRLEAGRLRTALPRLDLREPGAPHRLGTGGIYSPLSSFLPLSS